MPRQPTLPDPAERTVFACPTPPVGAELRSCPGINAPARRAGSVITVVALVLALAACADTHPDVPATGAQADAATNMAGNGVTPPARLGLCASCHGRDGIAIAADAPDLAGRPRQELLDAMQAYLDGRRDHGPMRAMLGPIRPAEHERLADWYAAQTPAAAAETGSASDDDISIQAAAAAATDRETPP